MIDRRAFLRRLGFGTVAAAAAASGVLDLEKLLWVPGEKTIFVPPVIAPLGETLTIGDVFTIEGVFALNPLTYQATKYPQQFVVTETVRSGQLLAVNQVCPRPMTAGPYANVSSSPVTRGYISGDKIPSWEDAVIVS